MSANMHDLAGWRQVSCEERDELFAAVDCALSTLTDIAGHYGPPVIYTEWGTTEGTPLLRDYMDDPHAPDRRCRHYAPEVSR